MNGLIRFALQKPRTVTVAIAAILVVGILCLVRIPIDILPVFDRPAVRVLTFYSGMPAENVANAITNRMERWVGAAAGMQRQESRSILGVSMVNDYFRPGVDPNGALTQVNSLALAEMRNLPPGTLQPIVLPYDPTATVPACLVALDSDTQSEATLFDVARFEVRNMIMSSPGAYAPVVCGGKERAILAYLNRTQMEARNLSPVDVLKAIENYNLFLPTGDAMLGDNDYAIDSNSMYDAVELMRNIPLRRTPDGSDFLGDVATPKDAYEVQKSAVRVSGRRQVYIPVYRQHGASTLSVVENLKKQLPTMSDKLTRPGIDLKLAMDQSVSVKESIRSLAIEGILGAVLCSLVILLFLGEWRMTAIAVLILPCVALAAFVCLYYSGETLNVMTLAGIALAIGPVVDLVIVVLENVHRHLRDGKDPFWAAYHGTREVVKPELVATISTLMVLAPLALIPSSGQFLFKPMTLAVAFAMVPAMLLAMSFAPSRCALWMKPAKDNPKDDPQSESDQTSHSPHAGSSHGLFARWQSGIDRSIGWYCRRLEWVLDHRWITILCPVVLMALLLVGLGPNLKREFFPKVDSGSFEIYVRARSGSRLTATEARVAEVEDAVKQAIGDDLQLLISQIGVRAGWASAFTPNSGPMDALTKVQLVPDHSRSTHAYVRELREKLNTDPQFFDLEFAFNAGGLVKTALNEGQVTPINIQVTGKNMKKDYKIAESLRKKLKGIDDVVDARIMQRMDYPEYVIDVNRAKARELGLTQEDVMKNVIAAVNSSIQFNKHNFWIDPVSQNQYFVGVQYPEEDIKSLETLQNIPITSPAQDQPIPLSNVAKISSTEIASEVKHRNLQQTVDLNVGIEGRDLGHVAADVNNLLDEFGERGAAGTWTPYDPDQPGKKKLLAGAEISLRGEYGRMIDTFENFGIGVALSFVLIYFLMVSLLDSYMVPLVVLLAVPLALIGILPMLYLTGTAIDVQSLLGMVFVVGIIVANTVLMSDFAQNLRENEDLSPRAAITKAAELRVRPIVMTALAAIFALVPMATRARTRERSQRTLGPRRHRRFAGGTPHNALNCPGTLFLDGPRKDRTNAELRITSPKATGLEVKWFCVVSQKGERQVAG